MFPAAAHIVSPIVVMGEIGWGGSVVAILGLGVICVLMWQLLRAQRVYSEKLAELSRELAEDQERARGAVQATEVATRESQAKSEMLATLSREIRAHLNGIIGSADLILDQNLKPQQRENLTALRASAESLHQSLNDVLEYSIIETGKIQINHASFDLRQPLIEVVETLSPLAVLKGLELILIVAPDVPLQVTSDAARLRQIFLNLTANAVKSTASGRVVLRVELPQGSAGVSPNGAIWVHFSVSDTSAGIPEEMQATIFDRSPLSDSSSSSRKYSGSGLELTISKRLVELMGGRIGARSLPEGGSEFWVVLALPADRVQVPPAPKTGLHAVVLDNLAASRVATAAMLTRLGVDQDGTDSVANAAVLLRDALDEGAREPVLLLDEAVAKESTESLAQLFAPASQLRATRVVLMSRNPDDVAAAGYTFPVAAVVRKPLLRAEALLEALQTKTAPGTVAVVGSRTPFDLGGEAKPPARRGPRVLVVDDDNISRSVTSQLLARLGCMVEVAKTGAEAITLVPRTAYELVFMDCQMPGMDGFEATMKIRVMAGAKAPPIVALTANISESDREKCFAAGMCDFVAKPVHKSELARVLKRWTASGASTIK